MRLAVAPAMGATCAPSTSYGGRSRRAFANHPSRVRRPTRVGRRLRTAHRASPRDDVLEATTPIPWADRCNLDDGAHPTTQRGDETLEDAARFVDWRVVDVNTGEDIGTVREALGMASGEVVASLGHTDDDEIDADDEGWTVEVDPFSDGGDDYYDDEDEDEDEGEGFEVIYEDEEAQTSASFEDDDEYDGDEDDEYDEDEYDAQLSSSSIAEVDRMRRARDCGDSIAAGAVASAGGLSTNLREWAAVEDEDASFVKVSDVPWMVAMEAGERNAREEKRNSKLNASTASSSSSSATLEVRDKEETELTAKYDTMLAWVLDKGGVVANGVNVSKVIGKPGDGRGLVTTGLTESSSSGGDESSSIVNVGDAVVKIPIALALSHVAARTYRVNDQPVGTLLRPLFNEQPTYALGKFISICPFLFPSVWAIRLTSCLCFVYSHDAPARTVQARPWTRVAVGAVREDAAARGAVRVGSPNPARYLRRGTSARVGTNG